MKTYLDQDDLDELEKATVSIRDELLVRLLRRTAGRINEVLGIAIEDIDFKSQTIRIEHEKVRRIRYCPVCLERDIKTRLAKSHKFCPVCTSDVTGVIARKENTRILRTVLVDRETLDMIKAYIRGDWGSQRDGRVYIFDIKRIRAWQIINDTAKRIGLPKIINPKTGRLRGVSPHRIRDGFATMAVKQANDPLSLKQLQEYLGHGDIGTTMEYVKLTGEEQRKWYDNIWRKEQKARKAKK